MGRGWIDGRGWVTFDPTPSAATPSSTGWIETRLRRMNMYLDAADTAWQQWVMAYNPVRQAALAFAFRNRLRSDGPGFGWPGDALSESGSWGLFALAVVLSGILLRVFGPRLWRLRRASAGSKTDGKDTAGAGNAYMTHACCMSECSESLARRISEA